MKKNFVTKSSEKSKAQKVLTGLIAVFMSLTLFSGCFVLFKSLDFSTPQIQQEDPNKKDWEDFSVDHLDGKGTENSPWQISSAEDLAFLSSSMKQLKKINADTNKFAVTKALSGVSVETIAADTEVMALATTEESQEANYYAFTSDINLSNYRWNPIPSLHGHLDGQGYTLNIGDRVFESKDIVADEYWEYDEETGTKNLLLAPFAGLDTPISGITVEGEILVALHGDGTSARGGDGNNLGVWDGTYCGGLMAKAENTAIVSSVVRVEIGYTEDMEGQADIFTESVWLGGVVGWTDAYLRDCYFHGQINIGARPTWGWFGKAASAKVGGICGEMKDGFIADCANYGQIVHYSLAEMRINTAWTYYGGICGKYTGEEDGSGGRFYRNNEEYSSFRERDDAIVRCLNFANIIVNTFDGWGGVGGVAAKANINFCGGIVGGMWEEITWQTIHACVNYGDIVFHHNTAPGSVGMICGKFIGNFAEPDGWIESPGGIRDCVNYGDYYRGDSQGDVDDVEYEGMIVGSISVGYEWWTFWWQSLIGDHYLQYFSAENYGKAYIKTDYNPEASSQQKRTVRSDFKDVNDTRNPFRMFGDQGQKDDTETDIGRWYANAPSGHFSQYIQTNGEDLKQNLEFLVSDNLSVVNNKYLVCKEYKKNINDKPFVSTKDTFVHDLVISQFDEGPRYDEGHKFTVLTELMNQSTLYFPITMIGAMRVDVDLDVKEDIVLSGIDCPFYSWNTNNEIVYDKSAYKNGLLYCFNTCTMIKYLNPKEKDGSYSHDSYHISWNSHNRNANSPDGYVNDKKNGLYYDQQEKDYYWKSAEHRVSAVDAERSEILISDLSTAYGSGNKTYELFTFAFWNPVLLSGVSFQGSSLECDGLMPVLRLKSKLLPRTDTLDSVTFEKQVGGTVTKTDDGIALAQLKYERIGAGTTKTYNLLAYEAASYEYHENDLWFLHITPKVGYAVTGVYVGQKLVYNGTDGSVSGNKNNIVVGYNEEILGATVPLVTNLHTNDLKTQNTNSLDLTRKWSNYGDVQYGRNNVWLGDFAMTLFVPCDCNGITLLKSLKICYKEITYQTIFSLKNAPNSTFAGLNDNLDSYKPNSTDYTWEQALLPSGVLTPLATLNSSGFSDNGYLAYLLYYHNGSFNRSKSVSEFELVDGETYNKLAGMSAYFDYGKIHRQDLVGSFVKDITSDQIDIVFIKVPRKTRLSSQWTYNEWNHIEEFLTGNVVGTAEFFQKSDNTSLSDSCWADVNSSNVSIRMISDTKRANAYDCVFDETTMAYLKKDNTFDVQKIFDDIYSSYSSDPKFFEALTKSTLANDFISDYKNVDFKLKFSLRTYTLRGDTITVNGVGGNVRLAYFTSTNLSIPTSPVINSTVMSNANNPIEVYYNSPVILIADDNVDKPNFAGFYVYVNGNEYLLSNEREYHFFFEDVQALVTKLYSASTGKDNLYIRAKYGSVGSATEGNTGTQPLKENGVWQIKDFYELVWVSNQVNSGEHTFAGETIKLVRDVDMLNTGFVPIGRDDKNSFQGVFDGQFFHINNLFVTAGLDARDCYGLFGYIKDATIKNLIIQSCNVSGTGSVGALVGYAKNSTIRRVEVFGTADSINVGGKEIVLFDIYTNPVDHLISFTSTGSSNGFPTSITTQTVEGAYLPMFEEREFDGYGNGKKSGTVGGVVGTSEGMTMVGCSNRSGVNGGGLIGKSLAETSIDQSFCTSADNLCGEGDATITNSYYGDNIAATYGMSLSGLDGVWSSETTLNQSSTIWTVMNGHLALKIFYWDA